MATRLTTTAIAARKGIKYIIIGLVLILIGRVLFINIAKVVRNSLPERQEAPNTAFGVLPQLGFPEQTNELPVLEYTVETSTGTLPILRDRLRVYALQQPFSTFASYTEMVEDAKVFGFTNEPQQDVFNERIYVFNAANAPSQMRYDIVTKSFSISYNLASDPSPLNSRSRTPESAISTVKSNLDSAGLLNDEIENGPAKHTFLKVEGQNLVRALALADAQLIQVNLFRDNLEKSEEFEGYPTVTSDPNKSNVWFILSGSGEKTKTIIAGEYKYFPIDDTLFATYPIKTAEQALRDLVDGKGYVANLGFNVDGNITLTDIYLAYYDPNTPDAFMQPVIVFEGRDDFVAYVPAVTDEYIDQTNSSE